ncbi:MAG: GNAT family N-acetyltransferase, partial [Bryobacteraceae bacterium]
MRVKTLPETETYRLQRVEVGNMSSSTCCEWVDLLARRGSGSPMHDPRSLRERAVHGDRHATAYFVYRGERLCGVASFQVRDWPLKWQLGELSVAQLPLRRLCLLTGGTALPEEKAAYALLFQEIVKQEQRFDAVYLEDIPVDSLLWNFVRDDPATARLFSRYTATDSKPRVFLRLEGTFDDYMDKFSAKHRKNLKRSLRLFEEQAPGQVRSVRITAPEEVESFLSQAVDISRKTYQWNLLGQGLRNPMLKERLLFMARQGWLRAYLLTAKDIACAFVIGFQYDDRYYLDDMGFDPAWRDYSVGKLLQLYLIRDLFEYQTPQIYDMGEYGPHKEEFGNDSYLQGSLFLLKRRAYPRFICAGHRACAAITT